MAAQRTRTALALVLAASVAGCHSYTPAELVDKPAPGSYVEAAEHNKLLDHPSPWVSGPASLGLGIGTIVGVPIMIVALPITLACGIAAFTDDPKTSNLDILSTAVAWPNAVCAVGGCYAFGSLPNLIVGDAPSTSPRGRRLPPSSGDVAGPPPAEPMPPPPASLGADDLVPNMKR